MKALKYLIMLTSILVMISCESDDNFRFQINNESSELEIVNDLLGEYLISQQIAGNIAERLVWNAVDFGAPVNITYELYGSVSAEFDESEQIGSTSQTNMAITVGDLMDFATALGLDDDPSTLGEDGLPNDAGQVFLKLRAFAGSGGSDDGEIESEVYIMNIRMIERTAEGAECPSIFGLGDGLPDAAWNWGDAVEFTCENNVYKARVRLANDNFRFFETNGDWDSGLNYAYFENQGYEIDERLESFDDADNNFRFAGEPGIYELIIDANELTITLAEATNYYLVGDGTQAGWTWDNPVAVVQIAPYVYEAEVVLNTAGAFRVFTIADDWDSGRNFPWYENEGYSIDERFVNAEDGDSNFGFTGTEGTYTMIINEVEKTITLE